MKGSKMVACIAMAMIMLIIFVNTVSVVHAMNTNSSVDEREKWIQFIRDVLGFDANVCSLVGFGKFVEYPPHPKRYNVTHVGLEIRCGDTLYGYVIKLYKGRVDYLRLSRI